MSVAVRDQAGAAIAERLIVQNDLSKLNQQERIAWYQAKCRIYGLDWRLAPFDYLMLKSGLKLYLNAIGADLLRRSMKISVTSMRWEFIENLCVATVEGQTPDGRTDREIGVVTRVGVPPDGLADLPMKALTKAKRRLVISMGAIGVDEDIEGGPAPAHIIPAAQIDAPSEDAAQGAPADAAFAPTAKTSVTVMTHHHLTEDQQEGMYNAAVERNVGGIMPVDTEQQPSTQTWGQVVAVITKAWMDLQLDQDKNGQPVTEAPHQGVLKDGRVSPGRVYHSLLALPVTVSAEEVSE